MNFKKINVRTARKLFEQGGQVFVLPNKTRVDSPWTSPALIPTDEYFTFDSFCNSYRYYNCNSELGKSLAYYVEV